MRPSPRALIACLALAGPLEAAPAAPGQAVVFVDHDLNEPFGVDFDEKGRAYIVQMSGHRVSVLDENGKLSVLAGTGEKGAPADSVPGSQARFNGPHHLLVGPDGALYVADTFNNCVRRIDLATGVVTVHHPDRLTRRMVVEVTHQVWSPMPGADHRHADLRSCWVVGHRFTPRPRYTSGRRIDHQPTIGFIFV